MDQKEVLDRAREILRTEAAGIQRAADRVGEEFVSLVREIASSHGKLLVSGVGKSGIVAEKIAATFTSTGIPAFYINPLNALHGDLGVTREGDLLLAVSNSGEQEEMLELIDSARHLGVRAASLTGNPQSSMAQASDTVLDASVEKEACPLGLAPTTSTTVSLALGDALAMVVMEMRRFQAEDFARFHPGGALRRRLKLKVKDIMLTGDRIPVVSQGQTVKEALDQMTGKESLGVTLVVGEGGTLQGILTDGDLRRILLGVEDIRGVRERRVEEFMTSQPKTIEADAVASEALRIMEEKGITSLAIVDEGAVPVGIIHLHDILGRGRFSV